MSALDGQLTDYLAMRRALGYRLDSQERLLRQFLEHLDACDSPQVTVADTLVWATLPGGSPRWHAKRMRAVRGFACYLHAIDVPVEVPPSDLLPDSRGRAVPYLYSDEQISALIGATRTLSTPHRAATYEILVGLLAVTGMRRGELIALDRSDVDPDAGVITIRSGKFGKARELALDPSTVQAVMAYLDRDDQPASRDGDDALLVSTTGRRLMPSSVHRTFATLATRAAIQPRSAVCRPRVHDLRHTFAVRTLLDAYLQGEAVGPRIAALSTYLGHSSPTHTYWYLEAAPELMALAATRLELHLEAPR